MYIEYPLPFSVQGQLGVIRCPYLDIAWSSKTATHGSKRSEIWVSGGGRVKCRNEHNMKDEYRHKFGLITGGRHKHNLTIVCINNHKLINKSKYKHTLITKADKLHHWV